MRRSVILIALLFLAFPGSAFSSTDQDRAVLEQLYKHLKAAETMVEGQLNAQGTGTIRVDYRSIDRDLKLILNGLSDALSAPRREPRLSPAYQRLQGEYLNAQ